MKHNKPVIRVLILYEVGNKVLGIKQILNVHLLLAAKFSVLWGPVKSDLTFKVIIK